ncbi:erythromycin esterase family protein [Litchfieldella anticariensis]|uniref:erythromycin esterase family protein n=1 Tax=Litchfieldella anticariensis TaxID=258591 RepID=UPI00039909C9|nr:erythromycin esterase family protein [Halomonas anticariensis]
MITPHTRVCHEERGFEAVLVEADWPDALRLNRFVRGESDDSLIGAFDDFQRFPQWMWRNHEVREFIIWLRDYNAGRAHADSVGFHGLDLYSLHRSDEAVIDYLTRVDPSRPNWRAGGTPVSTIGATPSTTGAKKRLTRLIPSGFEPHRGLDWVE